MSKVAFDIDEAIAEVRTLASMLGAQVQDRHLRHSNKNHEKGKCYEAWVMLGLADGLVAALNRQTVGSASGPYRARWHLSSGAAAAPGDRAVFRGSPGLLGSGATGEPGYITISRDGEDIVQLHNSLTFTGTSGVGHEFDIAGVRPGAVSAERTRIAAGGSTEGGHLMPALLALELKCHSGDIAVGIARQTVATRIDMLLIEWPAPLQPYCAPNPPGARHAIVCYQDFTSGAHRLSARFWVGTYPQIGKQLISGWSGPQTVARLAADMSEAI